MDFNFWLDASSLRDLVLISLFTSPPLDGIRAVHAGPLKSGGVPQESNEIGENGPRYQLDTCRWTEQRNPKIPYRSLKGEGEQVCELNLKSTNETRVPEASTTGGQHAD